MIHAIKFKIENYSRRAIKNRDVDFARESSGASPSGAYLFSSFLKHRDFLSGQRGQTRTNALLVIGNDGKYA
jgi:hypothetical protein